MPTVPIYDTPQVAPAGLPGVSVQGLNTRQLAEAQLTPDMEQRTGQDLTTLGVQGINAAEREQVLQNQVRVDAALNNVRAQQQQLAMDPNNGYLAQKGAAAIQPNAEGLGLQQVYGQKLQDTIDSEAAGLANDAQRRVFQNAAAGLSTQFNGQIQNHVLQENTKFGLETQQGTVALAQDTAERNWNNPDVIDAQMASIKAATWKAGQLSGEPADLIAAKTLAATSTAHFAVVQAALQSNNPDYAQKYIAQYKDDMTGHDLLRAAGLVTQDQNARVATGTAMTVIQGLQPKFAPSDLDRVIAITAQTESGGNPNAVGPNVPGQGTAKGSMQVMDKTNSNPGYGVMPAQDNSPQERARVGKDYMTALVKNYNGNLAQAWAAYNDGPGNVDAAIKHGGDWLASMPPETRAYVAKNMQAFQSGGGTSAQPSIQDVHNGIRAQLGPNADPRVLAGALAEGTRMYADQMNDMKTQGESYVQQAQKYLLQNGGNMASLPPDIRNGIQTYAPGKFPELQSFAGKVANPVDKDNMPAYHEAYDRPDQLAKMSDSQFSQFAQTNFTDGTQKQLAKLRQDTINGKTDTGPATLNEPVFTRELNNRLQSIGLLDAKGKPLNADQVGTISNYLRNTALSTQQQTGQKMPEAQLVKYIDDAFAKNVAFRSTVLGVPVGGVTSTPRLGLTPTDLPGDDLTAIKTALANRGVTNPTNDQIMRTYWKGNQ